VRITASAISLNVDDVGASASFVKQHFGFNEDMSADGFVSLSRADAGFNLIFLRTGLASFKPESLRGRRADGLLVVFVVEDVDAEPAGLNAIEDGSTVLKRIGGQDAVQFTQMGISWPGYAAATSPGYHGRRTGHHSAVRHPRRWPDGGLR
jgi:hypothetical protein